MKIKTIAAIILAGAMCVSMTACGESENDIENMSDEEINELADSLDDMSDEEIEKSIEDKSN